MDQLEEIREIVVLLDQKTHDTLIAYCEKDRDKIRETGAMIIEKYFMPRGDRSFLNTYVFTDLESEKGELGELPAILGRVRQSTYETLKMYSGEFEKHVGEVAGWAVREQFKNMKGEGM